VIEPSQYMSSQINI